MINVLKFGLNGLKNEFLYKIDAHLNQNLSKPTIVNLTITHRCNFRCKQCDYWRVMREELSTAQLKSIIFGLRKWLGPFYLSICGGEPFIRKDLIDIIRFSSQKGVITEVITNGSMLSETLAEEIVLSGLNKINFSLDGANHKTHDNLRNFKGAFNKVIESIKTLKSLSQNLNISLNTIIMNENLDELEDLVSMVSRYSLNGIFFRCLICNDLHSSYHNNFSKESMLWPKDEYKLCKTLGRLIELKLSGFPVSNSIKHLQCLKEYFENPSMHLENLACFAHMRSLNINCNGGIRICEQHVGDALKDNLKTIWYSEKAKNVRKQKLACKRSCRFKNPGDIGDPLKDKFEIFHRGLNNNLKIHLFRN